MFNDNWINGIVGITEEEKSELISWMNLLGHNRYKDFYFKIKSVINIDNEVNYCVIKNLSRYYFRIIDVAFSAIKFTERRFRAIIVDNSTEEVNLKVINNKNHKELIKKYLNIKDCVKLDKLYMRPCQENLSLSEYISETSINDLSKIIRVLPKSTLMIYGIKDNEIGSDLSKISEFRNAIAHCRNMFEFGLTNNLDSCFKTIFKYIDSEKIVNQRIEELKNYYNRYLANCSLNVINVLKEHNLIPFFEKL